MPPRSEGWDRHARVAPRRPPGVASLAGLRADRRPAAAGQGVLLDEAGDENLLLIPPRVSDDPIELVAAAIRRPPIGDPLRIVTAWREQPSSRGESVQGQIAAHGVEEGRDRRGRIKRTTRTNRRRSPARRRRGRRGCRRSERRGTQHPVSMRRRRAPDARAGSVSFPDGPPGVGAAPHEVGTRRLRIATDFASCGARCRVGAFEARVTARRGARHGHETPTQE